MFNNSRLPSTCCIIDRNEGSRDLSATAALLVLVLYASFTNILIHVRYM